MAQTSVRGDEGLLQEIVAIFLEECPAMLEAVRSALAAGDAERLRISAHTLKGAVVHFGARAAVAAATEIELAARAKNLAAAGDQYGALEIEMSRVTPALASYLQSARNESARNETARNESARNESARNAEGPLYAVSPGR